MGINLEKGQNINLEKAVPGLKNIIVGLGWDTNKYDGGTDFDLDALAFLLSEDGKVADGNAKNFIFFNNLKDPSGAVEHTGDNKTGEGEGDDEQLKVDLAGVPANVNKVSFVVNIFKAEERKQNFGQISNAFIRVLNAADEKEIVRYDLSEDYSIETGMVIGDIYRSGGEWKFKAVGSGYKKGLDAVCEEYGVK